MKNPADILNTLAEAHEALRDENPKHTPHWIRHSVKAKGLREGIEALQAAWVDTIIGSVDTMDDADLDLLLAAMISRRGVLREIEAEREQIAQAEAEALAADE